MSGKFNNDCTQIRGWVKEEKKIVKKGNTQDQFLRDTLKFAKENALMKSLPRSEMKG